MYFTEPSFDDTKGELAFVISVLRQNGAGIDVALADVIARNLMPQFLNLAGVKLSSHEGFGNSEQLFGCNGVIAFEGDRVDLKRCADGRDSRWCFGDGGKNKILLGKVSAEILRFQWT